MSNEVTLTEDKNSYLSQGNFEHSYRMANMIAASAMVPKAFQGKPQDVLVAMEMGRSIGLSPLSAVQNIAVINGKPSLYGDAVLAVCSGHPEFENINEEKLYDKDNKLLGYRCSVKRRDRDLVTKTFTIEDAVTAKLWAKEGPWKSYPERMLQMRARGFALRDSFADALGGVRFAEEVEDYEVKDITPKQNPQDIKQDLKALVDKNKAEQNIPLDNRSGQNGNKTTQTMGSNSTANSSVQTAERQVIDGLADIRIEADQVTGEVTSIETATLDQMTVINELMREKKFNTERKNKALEYFKVNSFNDLTPEQAEVFIMQLEQE